MQMGLSLVLAHMLENVFSAWLTIGSLVFFH